MSSRVRVYIATSLDGFIAGPGDDLSWLPQPSGEEPSDFGFAAFLAQIGALLMGRRTFEVVAGFEGPWPYGDTPVLVATRRALASTQPTVRALAGSVEQLVAEARAVAGARDVYLDGGALIRSALDAGLVDELTISVAPVILGAGVPLFAGASRRHALELIESRVLGAGMVQMTYRPAQSASSDASSSRSVPSS